MASSQHSLEKVAIMSFVQNFQSVAKESIMHIAVNKVLKLSKTDYQPMKQYNLHTK